MRDVEAGILLLVLLIGLLSAGIAIGRLTGEAWEVKSKIQEGIEECESTLPRNKTCGYEIIYSEEIE